ncbi:anti-sigma regulatory factor [Leptospira perolatii]|uniref:Anti-sigma regulatory factor n=2 Tax=Leptospira perolatii TaxID=2023191 RepID=A0A2M9ZSZ7_9LEPT|nr:anti-sigma regulatory factor [Leptospira perolatii]PJZ75186.1 anti-sigma regulatory factor [Leptospira perolatii]
MFIPPDIGSIREFRKLLRESLVENRFSSKFIQQIELAADEALTNSISANCNSFCQETIICRWILRDSKITLWIVDYGKGLKAEKLEAACSKEKHSSLHELLEKVAKHQENKCEVLPFKGKLVSHRNLGKGLQIMHTLMDSVKVFYHSMEGRISMDPKADNIRGSIIELAFDAKKHSA